MNSTTERGSPAPDGLVGGTGLWLYGVVPDVRPAVPPSVAGVAGGPVHTVRAADLTAVVSDVSLAEYGEEPLRHNLEDAAWLERVVRAHHTVVDALARGGPVVPARLATVYVDQDRIARLLTERHAEFAAALERVADRTEWGVKGYAVPPDTERPEQAEQPDQTGDGGRPGIAYLNKRRMRLAALAEARRAAGSEAAAVHSELVAHAVAARRYATQAGRLPGADPAVLFNGAYLVDTARADEFVELVAALERSHPALRLEITGPWPPYSFVGDPSAGPTTPEFPS